MIDINTPDLQDRFDSKQATVGVIGHGYVGQAVEHFFKPAVNRVVVYDKFKPDLSSLHDVVSAAEIIFICVPTPMNPNGSCHTTIVESALAAIAAEATAISRNLNSFIIVIKSTVPPGFTKTARSRFPMRIIFSPEYLTEANSVQDFEKTNRIVLGGDRDDCFVVYQYFRARLAERMGIPESLGGCVVAVCDAEVAEMAKLFANSILATKVIFSNEIYLLCQKLGIDYADVKTVAELDRRIGGHIGVPGIGGKLGYGGSCFPKDINSLRHLCSEHQTGEKLLTTVIERNEEVRGDRDWEELKGRAVVDE
jgi:nucleotide sugar dehydrogenase